MRKSEKGKRHLKYATIFGTISVIWGVMTVNPLLIIAMICSWIAYSGSKKGWAKGAEILYIAGGVTSTAMTMIIAFLGNIISLFSGLSEIAGGAMSLVLYTVLADAVIALAAVNSHKGHAVLNELKKLPAEDVGFFGSSTVYSAQIDDDDNK